jgi:hypothetical protein
MKLKLPLEIRLSLLLSFCLCCWAGLALSNVGWWILAGLVGITIGILIDAGLF